jgi:hypothetical protein
MENERRTDEREENRSGTVRGMHVPHDGSETRTSDDTMDAAATEGSKGEGGEERARRRTGRHEKTEEVATKQRAGSSDESRMATNGKGSYRRKGT